MIMKNTLKEYYQVTSKLNVLRKQLNTDWRVLINEYSPSNLICNVTVCGNFDSEIDYPEINLHCSTQTELPDETIKDIEERTCSRLDFYDEIISDGRNENRVYLYDFKIIQSQLFEYDINDSWLKD